MKKIPNWIWIILVIALLIGIKFMFFAKKEGGPAAGGKNKNGGPVSVNYYVTKTVDLADKVYTTGKIGAMNEIEIRPEISGKVTAIYFKEGEAVSAGSPIIRINDADMQAQLQKIHVQLKLAEQKEDRLKKLLAVNGISQEEYDIQANEVSAYKADIAYTSAQLAKTVIKAPFSGNIGLKNVSEGAYVSPAQVIASLVQTKPLFIEFSLPEKYSRIIKKGDKINFTYQDDTEYEAEVYAFEPKIDETTKTIRVRAMYKGNENFYPGSFVKVFVNIGASANSIMIPTQAIIPVLKGQKVFIARNGIAEEVMVITGIRSDEKIQITEGLKVGDTVLTTGLMSVKKESKVKLTKEDK
ncbi:MAG TPA: efflux RND transporter periplasmic adaptor subunit [Bacteroidia bacterium]